MDQANNTAGDAGNIVDFLCEGQPETGAHLGSGAQFRKEPFGDSTSVRRYEGWRKSRHQKARLWWQGKHYADKPYWTDLTRRRHYSPELLAFIAEEKRRAEKDAKKLWKLG